MSDSVITSGNADEAYHPTDATDEFNRQWIVRCRCFLKQFKAVINFKPQAVFFDSGELFEEKNFNDALQMLIEAQWYYVRPSYPNRFLKVTSAIRELHEYFAVIRSLVQLDSDEARLSCVDKALARFNLPDPDVMFDYCNMDLSIGTTDDIEWLLGLAAGMQSSRSSELSEALYKGSTDVTFQPGEYLENPEFLDTLRCMLLHHYSLLYLMSNIPTGIYTWSLDDRKRCFCNAIDAMYTHTASLANIGI